MFPIAAIVSNTYAQRSARHPVRTADVAMTRLAIGPAILLECLTLHVYILAAACNIIAAAAVADTLGVEMNGRIIRRVQAALTVLRVP